MQGRVAGMDLGPGGVSLTTDFRRAEIRESGSPDPSCALSHLDPYSGERQW